MEYLVFSPIPTAIPTHHAAQLSTARSVIPAPHDSSTIPPGFALQAIREFTDALNDISVRPFLFY